MASDGVSFSKEGLASAVNNFDDIATTISDEIGKIKASLEVIDSNWKGPEHDSASSDKSTAEANMDEASIILSSMGSGVSALSTNANKVSYNG